MDPVFGPLLTYVGTLAAQWGPWASLTILLALLLWREKVDHRATREELKACNEKRISEAREATSVLEEWTASRERERQVVVRRRPPRRTSPATRPKP